MGHRHNFNTGQMFDPNDDQSWNHMHPEQSYGHFARTGPTENSSIVYPVDNMSIDGMPYGGSHWNSTLRSNVIPSSNLCVEMPHHQSDASGQSRDPFVPSSSVGSFSMAPETYAHHASSSNYGAHTFNLVEGGGLGDVTSNGRGPYKRKSPGVPTVTERGSSSSYYNAGSSSDLSMPSDVWQEKQNIDCHHTPWDCSAISSGYGGNNIPVGSEATLRNVRSRALFESENTLTRTHLSTAPSHQIYMAPNPGDHSCPMAHMGQSSDAQMQDWGHFHLSHAAHGRSSIPDANVFNQDTNNFIVGGSNTGTSLDIGAYHNNFISSSTIVPQNFEGTSSQSVRGSRSSYTQRSAPPYRGASSNLHWGHSATSDEAIQLGVESYPSRHPRPFPTVGWRNSDRSGRTRISSDRFRSLSDEAGLRNRLASEGVMIVDRSALYGSRSLFDQHNDMRLDVDNMTYEELLALGERIGNVSTGLSEDLISRCLIESVHCSSDQFHEEGRCVICLEEYNNMDEVGKLRSCGHEFHVGCIRKWLSMKNLCPICKAAAMVDQMKEE